VEIKKDHKSKEISGLHRRDYQELQKQEIKRKKLNIVPINMSQRDALDARKDKRNNLARPDLIKKPNNDLIEGVESDKIYKNYKSKTGKIRKITADTTSTVQKNNHEANNRAEKTHENIKKQKSGQERKNYVPISKSGRDGSDVKKNKNNNSVVNKGMKIKRIVKQERKEPLR